MVLQGPPRGRGKNRNDRGCARIYRRELEGITLRPRPHDIRYSFCIMETIPESLGLAKTGERQRCDERRRAEIGARPVREPSGRWYWRTAACIGGFIA